MEIVQQFQSHSYSLFPPYPLLPAPAPRPLLSAPKVAGLLPARILTPFTDTILAQNDPTPEPFVSKDRARMDPEIAAIIGHLPTPDELRHRIETISREAVERMDARRRHYLEHRDEYIRLFRERMQ